MTCTEARFLKEVEAHQMTVLIADGVHRHVRFQRPGTSNMYFELVTWPGYLSYSGDMGCYVFTRVRDMFEFFRDERGDGALPINPQYWAEKCVASDRDGVTEYSATAFRERILEWLSEAEASSAVRKAVVAQVLSHADDGEYAAVRAAIDFECDGFRFQDFWETNLREYTHRFRWCCYALAWGIRQYDAATQKAVPA